MRGPSAPRQGVHRQDLPHQGNLTGDAQLLVDLLDEPAHIGFPEARDRGGLTHRLGFRQQHRHPALGRGQAEHRGYPGRVDAPAPCRVHILMPDLPYKRHLGIPTSSIVRCFCFSRSSDCVLQDAILGGLLMLVLAGQDVMRGGGRLGGHVSRSEIVMKKIVEGVITGVVIALILGAYDLAKMRIGRTEQANYIKTLVEQARCDIQNAEQGVSDKNISIGPDQMRFLFYGRMLRELKDVLDNRSEALSYQQRHGLIGFMGDQEIKRDELKGGGYPLGPEATAFYEEVVFRSLVSLDWLKLKEEAICEGY